jgi:hypothetical protein
VGDEKERSPLRNRLAHARNQRRPDLFRYPNGRIAHRIAGVSEAEIRMSIIVAARSVELERNRVA